MRSELRCGARWGPLAVVGSVVMVWLHTWAIQTNDYGIEAATPLAALLHGHFARFLQSAPAYAGSLELRAPFALIASLAGAGQMAVYRASALPCVVAAAVLGLWLVAALRRRGAGLTARMCVFAICVANPITYEALRYGHPEELLGAALCTAAVLCAQRDRPVWAGLLLGLAVANKDWALVAAGPVLVALPSRHLLAAAVAAFIGALFLVPLVLAAGGGIAGATGRLGTQIDGYPFHPTQVWWFLGHRLKWVPAMAGWIPKGARVAPDWLDGRAHLIIVAVSLPLSALHFRVTRSRRSPLLLLVLLLLLRCILDPWDNGYYALPAIIALVAWESVSAPPGRPPIYSLAATLAVWIIFVTLPKYVGVDVQSIGCLVVAVPATVALARVLYGPLISRRPNALGAAPHVASGPGSRRGAFSRRGVLT